MVTPSRDTGVESGVTAPVLRGAESPAVTALTAVSQGVLLGDTPARDRLLQMVLDAKGLLRTSHRALGTVLGVSAARAGRILGELASAGAIRVRTSSTGTTISLVAGGRA
jgi:CRP-like cAMP-binding protein